MMKKISVLMTVVALQVILLQVSYAQCLTGNCENGVGSFVYSSGAKYTGQFRFGKIHGSGTLIFSNKNKYTGEWIDNFREGKGIMHFANGNIYEGNFLRSKMHGAGVMKLKSGDRYDGNWENDAYDGNGSYFFKDGSTYVGKFKAGNFDGYGIMTYTNGNRYEGNWKNSKKEGNGTLYKNDGSTTVGTWSNGEISGKQEGSNVATTSSASEQAIPQGVSNNRNLSNPEEKNNIPNLKNCNTTYCHKCIGQYTYSDGAKYIGDFNQGAPEGKGTVLYANGDKYVGEWHDDSPDGKGFMYYKNGRVTGAIWKNGNFVEELATTKEEIAPEYVEVDKDRSVKIWAVVVGIGRYNHMPVLKYSDDDAYQYYAFLKSPEGGALPDEQIRVLVDEDATRANILHTMKQIFMKADENDVITLYFSGHGLNGAFLPQDYDGFNNRIKYDEISAIFNESHAKHKICIADACFSGGLVASVKAPVDQELKKFYTAFDLTQGGTALLMSSKSEEYSLEDNGLRSGVFSHFVIKGLKGDADADTNKIVTVKELFDYIYKQVRNYTGNAQTPTLTGNYDKNMPISIIR